MLTNTDVCTDGRTNKLTYERSCRQTSYTVQKDRHTDKRITDLQTDGRTAEGQITVDRRDILSEF